MGAATAGEVGPGFLSRGSASVYRLLVCQLLWLLASAPGLVLIALLVADASNVPVLALGLVPTAPALSAAVHAWRASTAEDDLQPARHFWHGYRTGARDVLGWWLPVLALGTVLALDLTHLHLVVAGPAVPVLRGATLVLLVLLGVVGAHALVISAAFTIRGRDVLRLSAHHLRSPGPSLGALALLVCAVGVLVLGSDWVLALLVVPGALLMDRLSRPVVTAIQEELVR